MTRRAVFAGSFDPITNGHVDLLRRGSVLFDEVVIACGNNPAKRYFLPIDERLAVIRASTEGLEGVRVEAFDGLLVDYCRRVGAGVILRGLRNESDFAFEFRNGLANRDMAPDVESVFLLCAPENIFISSSLVKDIFVHGGDISRYVPAPAAAALARAAEETR